MTGGDSRLWTDRSFLLDVQYGSDDKLAARQSIYAFQRSYVDFESRVLDLAGLRGDETVIDVGCGNGAYLAALARREHAGTVLGLDLSAGMLAAVRRRLPGATLAAGDVTALPLPDNVSQLTLAMHMLYHVPDPAAAVRELRRVTHPAGQVVVGLNGSDHFRELRELIAAAFREVTGAESPRLDRLNLDDGQDLLAREFADVTRHDFTGELVIPGAEPVETYARSTIAAQGLPDTAAFAAAVVRRIPGGGAGDQAAFRVRTHSGCLICS